jgi:hypothetical protein
MRNCVDNKRYTNSFVRNIDGTIATFHVPQARATDSEDINDKGLITGKFNFTSAGIARC